jgi:hypothetical protein
VSYSAKRLILSDNHKERSDIISRSILFGENANSRVKTSLIERWRRSVRDITYQRKSTIPWQGILFPNLDEIPNSARRQDIGDE